MIRTESLKFSELSSFDLMRLLRDNGGEIVGGFGELRDGLSWLQWLCDGHHKKNWSFVENHWLTLNWVCLTEDWGRGTELIQSTLAILWPRNRKGNEIFQISGISKNFGVFFAIFLKRNTTIMKKLHLHLIASTSKFCYMTLDFVIFPHLPDMLRGVEKS